MNVRLVAITLALLWVGSLLVLSAIRRFDPPPLLERVRAYVPQRQGVRRSRAARFHETRLSGANLWDAIGSFLRRSLGISDSLHTRLRRSGLQTSVDDFRAKQARLCAAFGVGFAVAGLMVRVPLGLTLVIPLIGAVVGFLLAENQLAGAIAARQRKIRAELPRLADQLALLLGSGFSLSGALSHVASSGRSNVGTDLEGVVRRVTQGVDELTALEEWAITADLSELTRFVSLVGMNRESRHLGPLLSAEARSLRRALHRDLITLIERRTQQVWIPVTVAALVPGVIFIAIPFTYTLRQFG